MAQSEKRENSVLFSLRELRQIEENRVQEEEQAVRSAEEQKRAAKEAAERAARDAEEARIREERDAQFRIEQARENAEREARMSVESAAAAERGRQQAALEQQRLHQEMELRRAEVAKKRPTWMLVVTGLAVVATVIAIILTVNWMGNASKSDEEKAQAVADKQKAEKEKEELQETVDRLGRDLADLDKKVTGAVDAVVAAQTDADRGAATARLKELQKQKAEMEQRIAEAKARAARAERLKGMKISKECQANPLAKGCS